MTDFAKYCQNQQVASLVEYLAEGNNMKWLKFPFNYSMSNYVRICSFHKGFPYHIEMTEISFFPQSVNKLRWNC